MTSQFSAKQHSASMADAINRRMGKRNYTKNNTADIVSRPKPMKTTSPTSGMASLGLRPSPKPKIPSAVAKTNIQNAIARKVEKKPKKGY